MQDDELEIEEVEETPSLEDDTPPAETSPPEEAIPVDDGFFEKMRSQFEKWGLVKARASKDALAAAAKMLGVNPKQMAKLYGQMMDGEDEEDMEMGKKPPSQAKPGKQSTRKDALRLNSGQDTPQEESVTKDDIQKAITDGVSVIKADIEKAYQEEITALKGQVESLSKEATDQRDQREEREFLEKAMKFRCFPVAYTELGGMLRQLNKAMDKESYEKWEAVLKAADAQLFTAGLFNEMGTAQTAEEVLLEERIEKIAKDKGIPLKDAVLSLTPDEQRRLVVDARAKAGGK